MNLNLATIKINLIKGTSYSLFYKLNHIPLYRGIFLRYKQMKDVFIAMYYAMYSVRKISYLFFGFLIFSMIFALKESIIMIEHNTYYFSQYTFLNSFFSVAILSSLIIGFFTLYYVLKFTYKNLKIIN